MDELLAYVTQLIDYIEANGANLNQETQQELAVFLQEVMQFIAEQSGNPIEGLPPSAPIPELDQSMPSSNINSFSYNDKEGKLYVKFQGDYPQQNGPIYEYNGVQPYIFDLFRKGAVPARTNGKNKWGKWWKGKNPSIGSSMFTLIKNGGYSYNRVG